MPQGELNEARAAHILRRTGFGPFPGQVEAALDEHGTPERLLDAVIDAGPLPFEPPAKIDDPFDLDDEGTANEVLVARWIDRMKRDEAGLHEKMTWFWHTHFPSSFTKSPGLYAWRQFRTLHEHALGNFAELTKAMCVDAAMLQYLDGSGSNAVDPNENLGRELMELFTLGRGNYTEDDVRAAARGLAGYSVSNEDNGVKFDKNGALDHPVTFLGKTAVFDVDSVVDRILEQDAASTFVVKKLALYLTGDPASDQDLAEWSQLFRSSGWEIQPVVEAMLRSDAFAPRLNRSRHGIEWLVSVLRGTGLELPSSNVLELWAQVPYYPPNVAGWPDTWLGASSLYARAAFLYGYQIDKDVLGDDVDDLTAAALAHAGLFEVSAASERAVRHAERRADGDQGQVLRAAYLTPEFALA